MNRWKDTLALLQTPAFLVAYYFVGSGDYARSTLQKVADAREFEALSKKIDAINSCPPPLVVDDSTNNSTVLTALRLLLPFIGFALSLYFGLKLKTLDKLIVAAPWVILCGISIFRFLISF